VRLGTCVAIGALLLPLHAWSGDAASTAGETIYRDGVTGAGVALQAARDGGATLRGAAAACVNCHQHSGLGSREGRTFVPPITGRYLMRPLTAQGDDRAIPFVEGMRAEREPYTDATLARAIREGIDSQGKPLSYLMPNYALDDQDMAALIAYLKRLDTRRVPGVTDTTLHFATIITPDADPLKRQGMLDVLKQFVIDRNARQMTPAPRMQSSGKTAYSRAMFMVHRRWELHVWELSGPESTWKAQLERRLATEPVFAVISGLGGAHWEPVHDFCEQAALPCLFPNVEVPIDRPTDFYPLYFSRGLLLESELMADAIARGADAARPASVQQIYRAGDSGEAGAAALAAALKKRRPDIVVVSRPVPRDAAGADLEKLVHRAATADALVLWLRPDDLAHLGAASTAPNTVYASGLMGGLERAPLPADWRDRTHLAYPFDLPERRRVRVDFALGWFSIRHIPLVAEQVQVDTYLACGLLSETLSHMVDTFVRDYLVERTQSMLEHRIVTGYYPRLALASDQRFASKGGYLVSWPDATGTRIRADGAWTVP
jgi:Cytochrome c